MLDGYIFLFFLPVDKTWFCQETFRFNFRSICYPILTFLINTASAAMTATFESKYPLDNVWRHQLSSFWLCHKLWLCGVMACPSRLTPHDIIYGVIFPNEPSVRIGEDCPNNIYSFRNNILIYDVDGRSVFNYPKKIGDEYNHSICFWNGKEIEFYTPEGCC